MPVPDPIRQPHDALFRAAFGDPERAAELLRSSLPVSIADAIVWKSLRRVDGSFVDEELRQGHADLLFAAPLAGQNHEVLLYVLLEHKSGDDRFLAFQMLRYITRIWSRWRRRVPHGKKLPPVLPFVLHHGLRPWRSPVSLRELVEVRGLPPDLIDLQPELRLWVDDLAGKDESVLRRRNLTVKTLLPLLHLQQLRRDQLVADQLSAWKELWSELIRAVGGQDLASRLMSYVVAVGSDDLDSLRIAYRQIHPDSEEQFMTVAEQLIEQGLQRGRQEGRQEGREVGEQEGRAAMVRTLLQQRFGPLADDVDARLRSASARQLELWAVRTLAAASIRDVLEPRTR